MKGTKLFYKTGIEGPKYDPYMYEEYIVHRNGKEIILHLGLQEWIEINGERQEVVMKNLDEYLINPIEIFEEVTGLTLDKFKKYYDKIQNTCKNCGCNKTYAISGFPGEIIYLCRRCDSVVSSDVNLSGII